MNILSKIDQYLNERKVMDKEVPLESTETEFKNTSALERSPMIAPIVNTLRRRLGATFKIKRATPLKYQITFNLRGQGRIGTMYVMLDYPIEKYGLNSESFKMILNGLMTSLREISNKYGTMTTDNNNQEE